MSAGAERAATKIIMSEQYTPLSVEKIADIIDRETRLPELLAACEAAYALFQANDCFGEFDTAWQLHDAIAKARGK
mgnify:CR=1 FL=1